MGYEHKYNGLRRRDAVSMDELVEEYYKKTYLVDALFG